MSLCLDRDDGVYVFDFEEVSLVLGGWRELFDLRSEDEGDVVFVSRDQAVGVGFRGLLDEREERVGHLLAIDDEGAVENLVAAVLRVYLCEAVHLAVGEAAANLLAYTFQILNLFRAEGETFLVVVSFDVGDIFQRLRLAVHKKHVLVEVVVFVLQHRVEAVVVFLDGMEFLDTRNAANAHVLSYFDGVGAPRCYHLAARSEEGSFHRIRFDLFGVAEEPSELFNIVF